MSWLTVMTYPYRRFEDYNYSYFRDTKNNFYPFIIMYVADIFTDQIHVFLTALNQNLIALLFIY